MNRPVHVGFIGFGEVARNFAPVLAASAGVRIAGALLRPLPSATSLRYLEQAGVPGLDAPAELAGCGIVLSLVAPLEAEEAAARFAPVAREGQIYADLNSTSPMVKQGIERLLGPRGVDVVDGAMSGAGTTIDGPRLPIWLAGPRAGDLGRVLAETGLNVEVLGDRVGAAAALKMVRGIVIKGLDALCFEARIAAHRLGLHDRMLDSLKESLDRMSIRAYADMLFDTHLGACRRRSMEATMIEATVRQIGLEPIMTSATRRLMERSVDLGLPGMDPDAPREERLQRVSERLGGEPGRSPDPGL